MNRQQLEILNRTGRVELVSRDGFMAAVVNGRRSPARKNDDPNDDDDPDDGAPIASRAREESAAEREERLAAGRKVTEAIENRLANEDARRIGSIDHMLNLAQCPEARDRLMFARNNGFELGVVWPAVLAMETEFRNQLSLVQEYREVSLGYRSASDVSRAHLEDDPDVRLFRKIANRKLLPGENLDEEEAEPTKKKGKRGDRSGDKDDFEAAEAGEVSEAGETGADDPDSIDEAINRYAKERAAEGWK